MNKIQQALNPRLLWEEVSDISGEIKVVEFNGVRRLLIGGYVQSRNIGEDGLTHGYWDGFLMVNNYVLELNKVLLLGLGGGTIVKLLNQRFKPKEILAVELDPVIPRIAERFFDLKEDNLKITIGDAKEVNKDLIKKKEKFDLIGVDVYLGDKPMDNDVEFYSDLKKLLSKNGYIIINKIFELNEVEPFVLQMKKIFGKIYTEILPGANSRNVLILMSTK